MARYGNEALGFDYSEYGTGKYGSDDVPRYRIVYQQATATDKFGSYTDSLGNPIFNRITVFWQYEDPTLEVQKLRVLRSVRGFALSYNDPNSVVLFEGTPPKVNFPTDVRRYVTDDKVIPGRDYYYSIFIIDPGLYDNEDLIERWVPAAFIKAKSPKNHDSINKLFNALPPYMTSTNVPGYTYEVTGVSDPYLAPSSTAYLPKFLAGLAWMWDYVTTDADRLKSIWNPISAPSETVETLAKTLGLPYEVSFGDSRTRALIEFVNDILGYRGASRGVVGLAEALSGCNASYTVGKNLMLSVQDASFTNGIGFWNPILSVVTSDPLEGSNLNHAPDTVFAIDVATPGCAFWEDSGTSSILSASGVTNSAVSHANNSVRVTTSTAHGLHVGDVVTVSGADNSFLNTTWVIENVFDNTSYGFSYSGSTSISGNLGRTLPPDDENSYPNPFSIIQGIPVEENTEYVVVFSAVADGPATVTTEIKWYDFLGNYISTSLVQEDAAVSTVGWDFYGDYVESPSKAKYAVIQLTSYREGTETIALDKFQFIKNSVTADPETYEEPRTIKVILSSNVDKGIVDRIPRSIILDLVTERLRQNLALGTPLIVRMTPVILNRQQGIPSFTQYVAIDPITFIASADTPTVTWSSTALPTGLSLDGESGELSGTPSVYGKFPITITATDEHGVSSSKSYVLTIIQD